jgi:N4-gp56 family major capsid protein
LLDLDEMVGRELARKAERRDRLDRMLALGLSGAVDAPTTTASLGVDQTAYDRLAYFALRPELHFDAVADVKPTRQSMPGTAVVFTIFTDLTVATTALNESVDVDAVALGDSTVTVTLVEYGNAVITTAKLRGTSFLELDPVVANIVGYNAGVSIDTIARQRLQVGTNVYYASTAVSRVTVGAAMVLTAAKVREMRSRLRGASVQPVSNGMYGAFIHPDVSYDLRGETGAAAWRDPHTYSAPENIWNGEIGSFESFRFMETERAPIFVDAGVGGTVDVYGTIFTGKQALAKAHSIGDGNGPYPQVRIGAVTDKLRRFVPMGWYWFGDYGIFRQAAVRRVESASSIGAN